MEEFIRNWGYLAVFAGTLFEGETVLVLAGFAAHRGFLGLPGVMLAAFLGSLAAGEALYLAGRLRGGPLLRRFPRLRPPLAAAGRRIHRWGDLVILGFRFTWLLRPLVPLALGLIGRVSPARFTLLNAAGAAAWAVAISLVGYLFGATLEALLGDIRHIEREVLASLAAAGLAVWGAHLLRARKRSG
jgi:membrane protein DedA with SNARE-associated domain